MTTEEIKNKAEFLDLFEQVKKDHPKAFISHKENDNFEGRTEYIHKIITCPYMGKHAEEQPETIATYKADKPGFLNPSK